MLLGKTGTSFRNIFILESRDWFASCSSLYDSRHDLVLTYDLALRRQVEDLGGTAWYVDHLVDQDTMQENNFRAYDFFRKWHLDFQGNEIFVHKGVPFGFGFRIEIWNDYIFYVRARLCLEKILDVRYESIHVGTSLGLVESILGDLGVIFSSVPRDESSRLPSYFCPIHKWMSENIRKPGIGERFRTSATWTWGTAMWWIDRYLRRSRRKKTVFVQQYHPTQELARRLKRDGLVNVLGGAISKTLLMSPGQLLRSRFIPLWGGGDRYQVEAGLLLHRFQERKHARLILSTGSDISNRVYELIEGIISPRLPETMHMLVCVKRYLEESPVVLEVMITNLGEFHTLVDSVSKAQGVPSYLIINGWLSGEFHDESKYATTINAYSTSIKDHYFRGLGNVVCLGDPRMDAYPPTESPRVIDREFFTVTIGVGTYSPMDLNSYVALEFEFMWDVLQALLLCRKRGDKMRVVIKLRTTSYPEQYRKFVDEYFPGLVDEYLDNVPMRAALFETDLYISHFSQTHFEASCLGIPCIYYKNDKEVLDPPFDGKSELVTARNVDELIVAIGDFRADHGRFNPFLERTVMEKYIGPLDGSNLERNLNVIYEMLNVRRGVIAH